MRTKSCLPLLLATMTLTACGSPFESATDHSITPPKQDCCGQEDAGVGDDAPSKDETGKPPPKHDAEVADAGCTACEAGSDSPTTGSEAGSDSPTTGPEAGADSPVTTPEAGSDSPEAGSDSPITGPEAGSDSPITNPEAGSDSPITSPEAGSDSPTTGPEAGGDTYVPPVNLITNGDWSVSNGTITTPSGQICVTTTAKNVQLTWAGVIALHLQDGASYTFSYSARANEALNIDAKIGNTTPPYTPDFETASPGDAVTTTIQAFTHPFTTPPPGDNSAGVAFSIPANGSLSGAEIQVCFANVSLITG